MRDESSKNTGRPSNAGTTCDPSRPNTSGERFPTTIPIAPTDAATTAPHVPTGQTSQSSAATGALMSSAAGSPAKTFRLPASERDSMETSLVFGGSSRESFAYFDLEWCWWRTYQASLLQSTPSDPHPSDAFLGSWPASGSMRNGNVYRRQPLVPRKSGSASSSSPTLTASDHYSRPGMRPSRAATGRTTGYLSEMIAEMERKKPTPSLNAASGDKGPRRCATKAENGGHQVNLIDLTAHLSGRGGGILNPRWCEWYMGFPAGWCEIPSDVSETPSSPKLPSTSADAS